MPANNIEQATAGIKEWLDAAQVLARAEKKVTAAIKFDTAVSQNWNNLATDFPELVADPGTDDTIVLDGGRQTFTDSALQQLEKAAKELDDFLQGNSVDSDSLPAGTKVVQVTGEPITRILEVLGGGV